DDVLFGGDGLDRFVFAAGCGDDRVMDFAAGDLLDLTAFALTWAQVSAATTNAAAETVVDLSAHGGGRVTLVGVPSLTEAAVLV
ncbi:MAG TPA: hypothetical protein VLL76_10835, partial [Candidatus Omnitrophota bacterium]|nr:hypothetical protein [Candidatus Omnitrophota bacterium]